ncbi:hypothetical protein [Agriterribacter sp.]|uniref:hypothetical protein n=1 Tax=Agriterribacter sp. TaxID=2821509 RepID=UPI002B80DB91|nr:hypothetical protein [Agriterribacter sp.]HRP54778.1 hypothetical protein [Agriterribacter sp.]
MNTRAFPQGINIILWVSFLQAALIVVSTVYAMAEPWIYAMETPNWRIRSYRSGHD